MLTLAQTVLISTLFISPPFESHEIENLEKSTTQSTAENWKTKEHKLILEREARANVDNENRNVSISKVIGFPPLDPSDVTTSTRNLTTDHLPKAPRPTATISTSPPLVHAFVSKLPLNSSLADKNLLPISAHPNSTWAISSENFSWPLDNDTMYIPDNSSTGISILPPLPTTQSVTPLTMEPTGWHTTDDESFAGFTPYREKSTVQPTLKFTNNSKLFPSTSDPKKENKNTGVVFGAILGAILGVSLLSLVGYLLYGKRKTDSFSHRRLYDDRNEPVLRLDNAPEPYDGRFGSPSYYNPSVNDSSMPEGRESARDGIPMDDIPPLRAAV
ncbi:PREDICTED: mucin-15 [Chinchilla lanigera]|uniref:Mucin 15, cell surface associated n=1 Tax=Chinchilla lanigera TaxID=34839 RepID=A0A8C2UPZ0_CHILA|nr:PREDICTED: mucin-15 [Chinchilla lanigera]